MTYGLRSAILSQKAVISCFSVLSPTVRRADGVYQDHRHDWEGRIARLTHKGEFTFVLLGVAEPTRPDQHDHGLGCADGLFQRANPRQTRRQITAVKEGLQALVTQDRIDICRVAPVRAGVADKYVVGRNNTPLNPC